MSDAPRIVRRYDQIPNGCWPACLAGLTGIAREQLDCHVPADPSFLSDEAAWAAYCSVLLTELEAHGFAYLCVGDRIPRGFAVGVGTSPRGTDHACIVYDGQLYHDPDPSRAGVERFRYFEVVVPILGRIDGH